MWLFALPHIPVQALREEEADDKATYSNPPKYGDSSRAQQGGADKEGNDDECPNQIAREAAERIEGLLF